MIEDEQQKAHKNLVVTLFFPWNEKHYTQKETEQLDDMEEIYYITSNHFSNFDGSIKIQTYFKNFLQPTVNILPKTSGESVPCTHISSASALSSGLIKLNITSHILLFSLQINLQ